MISRRDLGNLIFRVTVTSFAFAAVLLLSASTMAAAETLRAGAYVVDVTPRTFPIITSGNFLPMTAGSADGTLHARALALDDGEHRLVITVVDTLMMPREWLDRIKETASRSTGIPPDKMLIAATHSHSTPPVMGALGTDPNPEYAVFLAGQIVKAFEGAVKNLQPARVGWTVVDDAEHTHCRRWILRPDRLRKDPFGELTVRAHMHPGYQNPDFVGPAGPVDTGLTVLAFQTPTGRPIALLANYSMHYVGVGRDVVSPDYYGPFCEHMERLVGAERGGQPFVAIMSQGTSGDQHWMDYGQPKKEMNFRMYADALAQKAYTAYQKIEYRNWVPIGMAEKKLKLQRRVAGPERLAWAKGVATQMGGAPPKNQQEIYAREQIYIAEEPERELKLQAVRVGDLGIATTPAEVFAITGLKIKVLSPFQATFTMELANGAEGYIPPPEQHTLGGYTTWAARTAGLETTAEPKIVETVLGLLEEVSGKNCRQLVDRHGTYAKAVLAAKPLAYWRGNEIKSPVAFDATRHNNNGRYGDRIAFYLEGPASKTFSGDQTNRSPHYAGGRMTASVKGLGSDYAVEFWFWSGMPSETGAVVGHLFGRGDDAIAIGGPVHGILFQNGTTTLTGSTPIPTRTWHHMALVRSATSVRVYLDGRLEIKGDVPMGRNPGEDISVGGRADDVLNFAGKIDEVSLYGRLLSPNEIARRFVLAK